MGRRARPRLRHLLLRRLGLSGLHAQQAKRTRWLGLLGAVLLSLWLLIIMGFSFVEALLLPHPGTVTSEFVDGWMGMFNGTPSNVDLGPLPTLWNLTWPLYIGGGVLFGIATSRAREFPRTMALILAAGTGRSTPCSRPPARHPAQRGNANRPGPWRASDTPS